MPRNYHQATNSARKKLRKPSGLPKKKHIKKRWWHFGISEANLTKAKAFLGVVIGIVTLASVTLTLATIYIRDEQTFSRIADRLIAWHFKSSLWSGYYNRYFEGIVNLEEMNLTTSSTMSLALQSNGSSIDGVMAEKKFCNILPSYDYKLVRGTISHFGNSAEIQVYDFVGGRTVVYAEFRIKTDGLVVEVTPKRNSSWFGSESTRLIQHPDSTVETGFKEMKGLCKDEREKLHQNIEELRKRAPERIKD